VVDLPKFYADGPFSVKPIVPRLIPMKNPAIHLGKKEKVQFNLPRYRAQKSPYYVSEQPTQVNNFIGENDTPIEIGNFKFDDPAPTNKPKR
jgi:hypothetical protein